MSDKTTDILLSRSYDQSPPYWIALVLGYSIFAVIFVILIIYGYVELGIEYAQPPNIKFGVKEVETLTFPAMRICYQTKPNRLLSCLSFGANTTNNPMSQCSNLATSTIVKAQNPQPAGSYCLIFNTAEEISALDDTVNNLFSIVVRTQRDSTDVGPSTLPTLDFWNVNETPLATINANNGNIPSQTRYLLQTGFNAFFISEERTKRLSGAINWKFPAIYQSSPLGNTGYQSSCVAGTCTDDLQVYGVIRKLQYSTSTEVRTVFYHPFVAAAALSSIGRYIAMALGICVTLFWLLMKKLILKGVYAAKKEAKIAEWK